MSMNDRLELVALAHRRYPDMPLRLALMCFESDRNRAGLGALDESRRHVGANINNYKRAVHERGGVIYHLVRHSPACRRFQPAEFEDFDPDANYATATVTTVDVPAKTEHLCVARDFRDLREQRGRKETAILLRKARRQLSAASLQPRGDEE
jgi:hypothetical protein